MSPLTDIQDNIEKLRSLQESLHDLCAFISTLDLTSGAKEETLIHGITELKEAFANVDLSSVEQAITEVKNAVTNIDFSTLAKEETLLTKVAELKEALKSIDFSAIAKEDTLLDESKAIKDKIDAIEIPVTDLTEVAKEDTLTQGIASISQKVDNIVIPEVDTTPLAKEDTLTHGVNVISQKIDDIHIPELDKSDLAKEATLSNGISTLSNKIDNIDLSSVENKVDEGVETLSNKIDNIDLSAVESKVETESQTIQSAIQNIDLSSVENKVEEVKQAVENIDLTPIENKVDEGVSTLADKINNIDLSSVAKQGENQDATNTAIYALLSQFGESVLQEKVTVILNCQESIVWQNYAVSVTFEDGRVQAVPLSENGTCSFSIKIGQNYSVQLPIIGVFISPELRTYTAITSSREIYWSYISAGVFGIDELGKRYTTSQIEALENKSIIKYGGYTNEAFESYQNDDGTFGCGFMWRLEEENCIFSGFITPTGNTQFPEDLLPYYVDDITEKTLLDGKAYTDYIINTCVALGGRSELAEESKEQSITIGKQMYNGYILAYYQLRYLISNKSAFDNFYNTLGITIPKITEQTLVTSRVRNSSYMLGAAGNTLANVRKGLKSKCFVAFPLPK